jgi:hypothetical protein
MAKPDDKKAKRKLDEKLDEALRDTFPGSDPVSFTEPAPAKERDVIPPILEEYATEVREPVGYRRTDAEIAEEIRQALADDVGLDAHAVHVEVKNGEVRLRGTVRHCADMRRAEGHACAVMGATSVQSELQPIDRSDEEPPIASGVAAKMGKPDYDV